MEGDGADIGPDRRVVTADIDLAPAIHQMRNLAAIEIEVGAIVRAVMRGIDLDSAAGAVRPQGDRAGAGEIAADGHIVRCKADIAGRAGGDRAGGDGIARTRYRYVHRFTRRSGDGRQGQRIRAGEGDVTQRRRAAPGTVEGDAVGSAGEVIRAIHRVLERQSTTACIQVDVLSRHCTLGIKLRNGDITAAGIYRNGVRVKAATQIAEGNVAAIGGEGIAGKRCRIVKGDVAASGGDIKGTAHVAKRGAAKCEGCIAQAGQGGGTIILFAVGAQERYRIVPAAGADFHRSGIGCGAEQDLRPTIRKTRYFSGAEVQIGAVGSSRRNIHCTAVAIGLQRHGAGTAQVTIHRQIIRRERDITAGAGRNRTGSDAIAGTGHRHVHGFTGGGGDRGQGDAARAGDVHIAKRGGGAEGKAREVDAARVHREVIGTIGSVRDHGNRTGAGIDDDVFARGRNAGRSADAANGHIAAAGREVEPAVTVDREGVGEEIAAVGGDHDIGAAAVIGRGLASSERDQLALRGDRAAHVKIRHRASDRKRGIVGASQVRACIHIDLAR